MNRSLFLLLLACSLGANAQVKHFKAPVLLNVKADAPTTQVMRDSIVGRDADGQISFKTSYTYDGHGYLTSKLKQYADGTFDTDEGFFVDYEFDAQDRPTSRVKRLCSDVGTRGAETERVEASYGTNGYYYYERQYATSSDGSRFVELETGYDEWLNPVFKVERGEEDGRIVVIDSLRQQFTGRAYIENKYGLELEFENRCVYSIEFSHGYNSGRYRVHGYRREAGFDGDYYRATEYGLDLDYDNEYPLWYDISGHWVPERQYEWQLNEAHTRPLSMRVKRYENNKWQFYEDQWIDFVWDTKDRLQQALFNLDHSVTLSYTYADDEAYHVELEKILEIEDTDSWEDGGMDEYSGDLIWNWFGRVQKMHFVDSNDYGDYYYDEQDMEATVDTWDNDGRISHLSMSETWKAGDWNYDGHITGQEAYGITFRNDIWFTYREDGKVTTLIQNEWGDSDPTEQWYVKSIYDYDRWGYITGYTHYRSDSPEGPWVYDRDGNWGDESEPINPMYSPRRHAAKRGADWNEDDYEEGYWHIRKVFETDEEGNILWGEMNKEWVGERYDYVIENYADPVGPLEPTQLWEWLTAWESSYVTYVWDVASQNWIFAHRHGANSICGHRILDDGRIVNEYFRWSDEEQDMLFERTEIITFDDLRRVTQVDDGEGHVTSYSYYDDKFWLQLVQHADGSTDTYYYKGRSYVDPETLFIDEVNTDSKTSSLYDIYGRRVTDRTLYRGIYVTDGKKIVR